MNPTPRCYMDPNPVGKEVLMLSNEDEPPTVGILDRFLRLTFASGRVQHFPVVKSADGREVWGGMVLPDHPEIRAFIDLHGGKQAFNLLRDIKWLWGSEERTRKELEAEAAPKPPEPRPWWRFWGRS